MPTYEYECRACGGHFEYFHSIAEPPKTTCEACGGELSRLIGGGAGLIFKGSGFYITDYKKSGSSTSESPKPETKSSSGSGGSGSESSGSGAPAKSDKE